MAPNGKVNFKGFKLLENYLILPYVKPEMGFFNNKNKTIYYEANVHN